MIWSVRLACGVYSFHLGARDETMCAGKAQTLDVVPLGMP
jgi:hypothetical protein